MAISLFIYWPIPFVMDEYSYLLAANTFAHGRLTNPTHPMWLHFETFFVLHKPTYMSFYPPGQGLILALGEVLTSYPIAGVWLSIALACASLCWMLQAWLPARWAFLGAVLMVLKLGLFTYWGQSYWGGAVAATGGALLFGGFRRILKKAEFKNVFFLWLGLFTLAISRPYEGFLVSFLVILYLFFWMLGKKSPTFSIKLRKIILPLAALSMVMLAIIGFYNWSITGKFWVMPYVFYQNTYAQSVFIWDTPRLDIKHNNTEFEYIYNYHYIPLYNTHRVLASYIDSSLLKLSNLSNFFLGTSFAILFPVIAFSLKNIWVRFALLVWVLLSIAMLQVLASYPHYAAPGVCLIYFLVLQAMRRVYVWKWRGKPIGSLIVWSVPLYSILIICLPLALELDPFMYVNPAHWESPRKIIPVWSVRREEIISELKKAEGQHLIIVKYWPAHNIENEWVYNEADIDNAKIVWARNMGLEKNCELIKYFSNRKIWLLTKDKSPKIELFPYPMDSCK